LLRVRVRSKGAKQLLSRYDSRPVLEDDKTATCAQTPTAVAISADRGLRMTFLTLALY
jgi:hypothetical protein